MKTFLGILAGLAVIVAIGVGFFFAGLLTFDFNHNDRTPWPVTTHQSDYSQLPGAKACVAAGHDFVAERTDTGTVKVTCFDRNGKVVMPK